MFDVNNNIFLQYSTSVWSQIICFLHNTYFKELFVELSINSYKLGFFWYVPDNESKVNILGWNQSIESPNICINIPIVIHQRTASTCIDICIDIHLLTASPNICIDIPQYLPYNCIIQYLHQYFHPYSPDKTITRYLYQHSYWYSPQNCINLHLYLHWYSPDNSIAQYLHRYYTVFTLKLHCAISASIFASIFTQ